MNQFQRTYALARAHCEIVVDLYRAAFTNHPEYVTLFDEQEKLLDFEPGTPEYTRACDIEERLNEIERDIDTRTGYTEACNALQAAEEMMVQWSFDALRKQPIAFVKAGVRYSDIEVLLPHMKNLYSPIRKKLVDLAFQFAG